MQLIFISCWNISAVGIFIWNNRGRVIVLSWIFTLQKSAVIYTASKLDESIVFKSFLSILMSFNMDRA